MDAFCHPRSKNKRKYNSFNTICVEYCCCETDLLNKPQLGHVCFTIMWHFATITKQLFSQLSDSMFTWCNSRLPFHHDASHHYYEPKTSCYYEHQPNLPFPIVSKAQTQ